MVLSAKPPVFITIIICFVICMSMCIIVFPSECIYNLLINKKPQWFIAAYLVLVVFPR